MSRFTLLLFLSLCAPPLCAAQTPRRPAHSPSHERAAAELVEVLNLQKVFTDAIEEQLKIQLAAKPELAPYAGVMREFFARYMSWEKVKPRFASLYADAFTEEELHEMLAFFRTKTGQKMASMAADLMKKGSSMGVQLVQENEDALRQMILARARELEQGKP